MDHFWKQSFELEEIIGIKENTAFSLFSCQPVGVGADR